MSLSNKSAVLLFMFVLTLSVFMTPSGPVATELASSPNLSPATQEQINEWYETVAQPGFSPEIDAALAEWMETGKVADELVTTQKGVSALVVVTPGADMDAIRAVVDVDYFVNLNYFKTLKVTMNSPEALAKLAEIEGVGIIDADTWRFPIGDDLVKELDIAPTIPSDGVDMEAIYNIVGANDASVTETGVDITVGHVDTGADFGNPELQSSYNIGSYDPTGEGLTPMWYYANSTNVANVTAWLEDGNLLTYVDSGDVYLNVTGWDPLLNMYGSVRYLYGDGGYTTSGAINPYNDRVGFIWLYAWAWGIQINDTWLESTMQDWKLPATTNLATDSPYQVNWVFQQHNGPYAKIFAPALVYNGTDLDYHLVINWEDTDAWNWLWTGGFYYETLNMSHTVAGDLTTIYNKFDWDFTDDFAQGVSDPGIYDATEPIVAHDYSGDNIDDFSLGALSWCYDAFEFGDDPMFWGFSEAGDFCLYWDDGTHGTATAAHVAADGLYAYEDPNSGDTFEMKGIAPDADIISVRALSGSSDYFSYIWCAGFEMTNETSGEFEFTGEHMADLVTNSWGWVTEPASQMNYLAFTWEILASPTILDGSYPGVLHVFSAGNEGEGYMTIGPPGAATAIMTVGASTASDWLSYLYGDTPATPYEGIASFSSKGPSFTGYPKPDVLAPGLADYSAVPWYFLYYAPAWNGGPYGDEFDTGVNVTLFSGTSQAAPVAAGVIALAMDAMDFDSSNGDDPFVVKMMMQHTAEDLGYDPATQGFGRISIVNFIDFYENGGYYGGTLDSAMNYADFIGDSWAYWGILPGTYMPVDVNSSLVAFPDDNYDGAIFFGQVFPDDVVTINYEIWDELGTLDTADWSGVSDAYKYVEGDTFTFTGTTYSYNDTVVYKWPDCQMYGWFNISDELGTDYATLMGHDMVSIIVGFDAGDVAGDEPWMFLYEWTDGNHDGMPNLYNATTGYGDELDRLTSAGNPSNVNFMVWAGDMSIENMTLVIHDPIHDVNMTAPGNDFTVTLIGWDLTADTDIAFADNGVDASTTVNVTLTVPSDADAGIHIGFIDFDGYMWVPYSYTVVFNITADAGAVNTVFDGFGAELEPYDNTLYGCMYEDPDAWDFRSYVVYNPYDDATYLGVRAEWEDEGNDLFIQVYDAENGDIATSSAETATSTALLGEIDGKGYYYILVHPLALNGTVTLPANFTLEAMVYDDLTDQPVILSYTSDDRAGVTTIANGDTVWGDHAVINASYPAFNLPNMPEFEITSVRIGFLSGVFSQHTGNLVVPDASYDPFSGTIDTTQFAWDYIDGIVEGDTVDISVDFTNGDCDIMVWWADTDNTTWSYGNNLVADSMATGAHPEVGSFTAGRSGRIAVGIFDYDLSTGQWEVTVDTRVGVYESDASNEVTYDSYDLGRNGTFSVQIVATTATNIGFQVNLAGVTFQNYFSPYFQTVEVSGASAVKTIEWTFTDLNAQDDHTFEVLLSGDAGETYQLIATGIEDLEFDWDSTGFTQKNYQVLVRVTDSYGLTDEIESDSFAAGTVPPTSEPTTPTTPTEPTGPVIGPEVLLWIGLIGGIGVGVVVILILFLVKKR